MNDFDQTTTQIYTVTQLNQEVKSLLEGGYGTIRLEGEISGIQTAQSGHSYFRLKDESAEIDCALFRRAALTLKKPPENGQQVILTGQVTLYTNRGRYQFIVEKLEHKDQGAMHRAYLRLKKKLEDKGYFNSEHKQSLPIYPKRIGIITSPSGAAVEDVIRAFNRRNPTIRLVVYPTAVQGEGAAKQIAQAINLANDREQEDSLIIARGGGSAEDLWAFNEEVVADAIYASRIPIVTGIGHETDFTIADFVADERLATPTAAAERMSTPSRNEILGDLSNRENDLNNFVSRKLNELSQSVDLAQKGLVHPQQRIENLRGKFDLSRARLKHFITQQISTQSGLVSTEYQRLLNVSPIGRIKLVKQRLAGQRIILNHHVDELKNSLINRIKSLNARLEGVNPTATLNRGFSIIRRKDDNVIVSQAKGISAGEKVTAQLADGMLHCEVDEVEI